MDVLLVAAKKDLIDDYVHVITRRGPAAGGDRRGRASRSRTPSRATTTSRSDEVVALVNVGSQTVNINILAKGAPAFTRDISTGGNALHRGDPEGALGELGRGRAHQDRRRRARGEPGRRAAGGRAGDPRRHRHGDRGDPPVARLLRRDGGRQPDRERVLVSGGGSRVSGFESAFQGKTNLPVARLNPLGRDGVEPASSTPTCSRRSAPRSAVAMGLAMRRMDRVRCSRSTYFRSARRSARRTSASLRCCSAGPSPARSPSRAPSHLKLIGDVSRARRARSSQLQTQIDAVQAPARAGRRATAPRSRRSSQKLEVIDRLERSRSGPVHMLDELALHAPDRLWLTGLDAKNGQVEVKGMSLDNELVALLHDLARQLAVLRERRAQGDRGEGRGRAPPQRVLGDRGDRDRPDDPEPPPATAPAPNAQEARLPPAATGR